MENAKKRPLMRVEGCPCCQGAPHSSVLVVGCGSSTGLPAVGCLRKGGCEICLDALNNRESKNRRNNPSILIKYFHGREDSLSSSQGVDEELGATPDGYTYILIDCGKTFRDAALSCLVRHGVPRLDAVIITHDHADAIYGLDDLRDWRGITADLKKPRPLTIHVTAREYAKAERVFPYLVDAGKATGSGIVGSLQFQVFDPNEPLNIAGLTITPLRVHHGLGSDRKSVYECLGFKFGRVAYISDTNFIPEETRVHLDGLDVLFMDALNDDKREIVSHLNLKQSLAEVEKIRAHTSILTGLGHSMNYYKLVDQLQEPERKMREALGDDTARVIAAYDGMSFTFDPFPSEPPRSSRQETAAAAADGDDTEQATEGA